MRAKPAWPLWSASPSRRLVPLDDSDQMALGIRELAQDDLAHDVLGAHDALAAEALGLLQRLLDVRHRDVERHVAVVALGALAHAPADADAVASEVAFPRDHPVVVLVVCVDLPTEELGVVPVELLAVLPDDLEVHDRLSHLDPPFE